MKKIIMMFTETAEFGKINMLISQQTNCGRKLKWAGALYPGAAENYWNG